ncbi:wall-associated receptor kinase-like protein 14 [Tanacetum coccineum]
MILHELLFISMFLVITTLKTTTYAKPNCTRVCGRKTVPYPFGFSDGCEIRLNCTNSPDNFSRDVTFHEYVVQNVTKEHLLVILPAKCDRPYEVIRLFNSNNFALTSRNGLLLENCSEILNDCMLSTTSVENHFNIRQCGSVVNRSMNCYSQDNPDRVEFLDLRRLEEARCQVLFSSITVDINGTSSQSLPVSLEFQLLELGWWVRGECSCDRNAGCQDAVVENRTVGYRCNCNDGFEGDGFRAGNGCRKG